MLMHTVRAELQRGPGHQTQAKIQSLLAQAMAARRGEDASLGDDIIRRPGHQSGPPIEDEVLYQVRPACHLDLRGTSILPNSLRWG